MPLVVAAIVLAIGAGAAAVVLGSRDTSPSSGDQTPTEAASTTPADGASSSEEAEPTAETELPSVGRAQMAREIQALLLAYHRDVVERDFQAAWSLLSPRKRRQYLGEGGYRKWMAAQASLSPYLSPSGLTVRLDELEGEGVARVMVTGMAWSKPGSSCGEWSGLTWVRYLGGEWTYDPGYSTTPSRRAAWQPHFHQLLGADC